MVDRVTVVTVERPRAPSAAARVDAAGNGDLRAALDDEARAHVTAYLEPRAAAVDSGAADIREGLAFLNKTLADAGNSDAPNRALDRVAATIATAAACDMSTAFSLWCHRMVLEYISHAPAASPLRREIFPRLARTELLGSTALAAAMAHFVSRVPLPIEWRREGSDFILDGRINWASNLVRPDFIMVTAAARAGTESAGDPLIVAIPGGAAGLDIQPYPDLLALQATSSSSLVLRGVRVPEQNVIAEDFGAFIAAVRPTFLLLQSSFCWGLARRALDEARAGLRGVSEVFCDDCDDLEARAAQRGHELRERSATRATGVPMRDLVRARLECAQLATAAVALEAKVAGGRGYVRTCATARRLREAAFLPIQAPTEGQLRWELSHSA